MHIALTVGVTTDSHQLALGHLGLHHGWLLVDNILHGQDDLESVLPVNLLAVLESLNHVVDELLCHLVAELDTIV